MRELCIEIGADCSGLIKQRPANHRKNPLPRQVISNCCASTKKNPAAPYLRTAVIEKIHFCTILAMRPLILSDYGKGVHPRRHEAAIDLAAAKMFPCWSIPKAMTTAATTARASMTPNRKKLARATGGFTHGFR